jgi:hypothetical protein
MVVLSQIVQLHSDEEHRLHQDFYRQLLFEHADQEKMRYLKENYLSKILLIYLFLLPSH